MIVAILNFLMIVILIVVIYDGSKTMVEGYFNHHGNLLYNNVIF